MSFEDKNYFLRWVSEEYSVKKSSSNKFMWRRTLQLFWEAIDRDLLAKKGDKNESKQSNN